MAFFFEAHQIFAADQVMSEAQIKAVAMATPSPDYPLEAQGNFLTGRGIFRLHVETSTGRVTRVQVAHSTGYSILDKAAIDALERWRFRPGSVSDARIPVNFSFGNRIYSFSGLVRFIQAQRPGLRVHGTHVTDTVIISPGTQITKNGKRARFNEIRLLDRVEGDGYLVPRDFRVYARLLKIISSGG